MSIFFVLSGHVLSIKPLQHIRSGNSSALLTSLSSSLFRRPIRLFLPTIPAILATFLGLYFGWNGNDITNTPYYSAGYDFFHLMIDVLVVAARLHLSFHPTSSTLRLPSASLD